MENNQSSDIRILYELILSYFHVVSYTNLMYP